MQKKINKISIQLFNKLLFTLSILSILSNSCNPPGIKKQDMEHPPSNDNNHMQPAEETTFTNNKHLALLDIVERMSVYLEEEKQKPLPDLGCGPAYQKAWLDQVEASISNREQFVNELHQNTLHLLNNKMDINRYLYHLLNKRFNYLDNRAKSIKSYLTAGQIGSVIPTNKDLFEFLAQDKVIAKEKDFNEQVRLGAVTKFELLNLLIRESYRQCTFNELSRHTIKLLRASVQLHPILTGERRDLGHPDEAGGPYAILEPLVVTDSTVVKENYPTLFVGAAIVKKLTEEINKKRNYSGTHR